MYGRMINERTTLGFRKMKLFLYQKYLPKKYTFKSKVPINPLVYKQIPNHQWKAQDNEQHKSYERACVYFMLFWVGFAISDFFTSSQINSKDQYWSYMNYPLTMRKFDQIFKENQNVKEWLGILDDIWVKDYIEFMKFWDKASNKLFDKTQQNLRKDEKARKLRQEIEQMDIKYPSKKQKAKASVF